MSVWNKPTYKTSIPRLLYRVDPKLVTLVYGTSIQPTLAPDPEVIHPDATWEELAESARWAEGVAQYSDEAYAAVLASLPGPHRHVFGTQAVLKLIAYVASGEVVPSGIHTADNTEAIFQECVHLTAAASQGRIPRYIAAMEKADKTFLKRADKFRSASRALKKIAIRASFKEVAPEPDLGLFAMRIGAEDFDPTSKLIFNRVGNVIYTVGTGPLTQQALWFSPGDISHCIGALERLANSYEYFGRAWAGSTIVLNAIHTIIAYQLRKMRVVSEPNSYLFVKALKAGSDLAYTRHAESLLPEVEAEIVADGRAKGLNQIADLEEYAALIMATPGAAVHEALALHKWLPPPNFDTTLCGPVMRDLHANVRPCALTPGAPAEWAQFYSLVRRARTYNFAMAYNKRTGEWPPGLQLNRERTRPTWAGCDAWIPRACVEFISWGDDFAAAIKDKSTIPRRKADIRDALPGTPETSYLLWFLKNAGTVSVDTIIKKYAAGTLGADRVCKLAYKDESHKENSRMFYIASPEHRLALALLEANLADLAKDWPSSLMGLGPEVKDRKIARLMDRDVPPGGKVPDAPEGSTTFLVQFDLSKFSANAPYEITREYHEFWAAIYGKPELAELSHIGCHDILYHCTDGIEFEYKNPGADLEGFRGRLMTMLHADILSAAITVAQGRGHVVGPAELATFIDDGAMKVAVRGSGDLAMRNVRGMIACMEEVYAAAGQKLKLPKVCVSTKLCTILAETYENGVRVAQGVKAAMRIAPDYEDYTATIADDNAAIVSAAQGAVKAGMDWTAAYAMMITAVLRNARRWAARGLRSMTPMKAALWMFTPKSYGGLGIIPFHCLVSTLGQDQTVEGIGLLVAAAKVFPRYQLSVNHILSRPVVMREPLAILRDPTRIRAATPVIAENRLTVEMSKRIRNFGGNFAAFLELADHGELIEHAKRVAEAVTADELVNIPIVKAAWEATPLSYVESIIGKFKRAETIKGALPERVVRQLRSKARRDVDAVILEAKRVPT